MFAVAERLNIARILTLDQRDFHMVRPKHTAYFEILPSWPMTPRLTHFAASPHRQ